MSPTLRDPIDIGTVSLRNRLYRAPVLEGAGQARDPVRTYAKHFVANAKAGVGLVIQGNTIVTPEGRTSPGMSCATDRDSIVRFRAMTDAVHAEGAAVAIQLGHGGAFAIEAWHAAHRPNRARLPLAPSRLPLWMRAVHDGVHVPSTDEVGALVERFGEVASWAREAGYDAVQLAAGNAKLLHMFLSPTFNRRRDRYGGDAAGRFTLLAEIRAAIAKRAGADFPVWLKFAATEVTPFGEAYGLDTALELARCAEQAGFDALTPAAASTLPDTAICRGDDPRDSFTHPNVSARLREATGNRRRFAAVRVGFALAARRFPSEPAWNRTLFAAVKRAVSIPVFGVGGIHTPTLANDVLAAGDADLIGVGRPFYAEPELAARWLEASDDDRAATLCERCNLCVVPQMLGLPGVCYNPRVHRARA